MRLYEVIYERARRREQRVGRHAQARVRRSRHRRGRGARGLLGATRRQGRRLLRHDAASSPAESKVRFLRDGAVIWKGRSRRCGASRTTSARSATASSAVSASRTTRTSSRATSSRPSRSARSPGRNADRRPPLRPAWREFRCCRRKNEDVHAGGSLFRSSCSGEPITEDEARRDPSHRRRVCATGSTSRSPRSTIRTSGSAPRSPSPSWRAAPQVREVLASVERFVVAAPDVELLDVETAWLESERSVTVGPQALPAHGACSTRWCSRCSPTSSSA